MKAVSAGICSTNDVEVNAVDYWNISNFTKFEELPSVQKLGEYLSRGVKSNRRK